MTSGYRQALQAFHKALDRLGYPAPTKENYRRPWERLPPAETTEEIPSDEAALRLATDLVSQELAVMPDAGWSTVNSTPMGNNTSLVVQQCPYRGGTLVRQVMESSAGLTVVSGSLAWVNG